MSGNYIQCSECGKRALRIATRCPHCGHEFPPKPEAPARRSLHLGRYLAVLAAAGVAAALIALAIAVSGRIRKPPAEPTPVAAVAPDTAIVAESPPASPQERRFARTWTKVRTRRSTAGDVAAVLLPGDTVLVDSLQRGWWRVTLEGKVLGYVHQSTLETEPAAPGPHEARGTDSPTCRGNPGSRP